MANTVTVKLEYVGLTGSFCRTAEGVRFYEDYRLPAVVSWAIGLGCTGRIFSQLQGEPPLVAHCHELTSDGKPFLAAIAVLPEEGGAR